MSRYTVILFFIIIGIQSLFGQSHNFEQLSTLDGLPSNHVYDILVDKKGYTWFATDRGVSKYDGHTIKTFTAKDGLTSNDIWRLYEDSFGRIWLYAFTKEIMYIENDSVRIAGQKNIFGSFTKYMEAKGVIYTMIDNHVLWKFDKGQSEKKVFPYSGTSWYLAVSNSKVLQITFDGFALIDDDTTTGPVSYAPLMDSYVNMRSKGMAPPVLSHKDKCYFIEEGNRFLHSWDYIGNTTTSYDLSTIWKGDVKYALLRTHPSGIQVRTNLGCVTFDEDLKIISTYHLEEVELTTHGDYVYETPNKDIFINRKGDGVYILSHQKRYASHQVITDKNIKVECITPHPTEGLLLGMSDGSVYQKKGSHIVEIISTSSAGNDRVRGIYFINNQLWLIRQASALTRYNLMGKPLKSDKPSITITLNRLAELYVKQVPDSYYNTHKKKYLIYQGSTKAAYYHTGLQWLSLGAGGYSQLFEVQNVKEFHLSYYENLRQYATVITNDSIVWYGGINGLSYVYQDSIYYTEGRDELYNKKTEKLLLDDNQNLWVGTDGYGIYCYQEGTPIQVKGCENDIVLAMFLDEDNGIWISTNHGVKHIVMQDGMLSTATVARVYTTADGLSVNSPSAIYAAGGILYAGSYLGLDELDVVALQQNSTVPLLYITNVAVNDSLCADGLSFDLSYDENDIRIDFSGVSYTSKKGLKYHYFLRNHTTDTLVTHDYSIVFNNLVPGDYQLMLQAEDETGLKSEALFRTFHIAKPWYRTLWAYLLYFLAVAGGIYLIVRYFQQKIQKRKDAQRRMAELELHALQSQMNPHFIFNALNAIRQFQVENDTEEADKYFNGFATLMRLYLESSKKSIISLEDELKLLNIYLDLEKLRFDNKFESIIEIDEDLEPRYINIPSMLLQPFVENAVNHGLFHKMGKGLVTIKISEHNENIHIIIRDDGIGRAAAKEIQKNSMNNYKSRALQITEERIAVLKKQQDVSIEIKIDDLFDEAGESSGTEIRIIIPEIY